MSKLLKTFLSKSYTLFLITISILLLVSSTLLVYSYSVRSSSVVKYEYEYAYLKIAINTQFIVKQSLIYDYKTIIVSNETYLSIARKVLINISPHYSINSNTDLGKPVIVSVKNNTYSVIETEHWSKEYRLNTLFINKTNYIEIDLDNLLNIVNTIDSEIKTRSYNVKNNIFINIVLFVKYSSNINRTYVLNSIVKIEIDSNSNKLRVSSTGTERIYRDERVLEEAVVLYPLNTTVVSLRRYTLYSTVLLAIILILLIIINLKKNIRKENYLEILIKKSIQGRVVDYGNKTVINTDYRTLMNLSKIYGLKPIYDSNVKKLYLILRDIVYTSDID